VIIPIVGLGSATKKLDIGWVGKRLVAMAPRAGAEQKERVLDRLK